MEKKSNKMEKDKDFHKLMNRIAITMGIFLLVTIVSVYIKKNPLKNILYDDASITLHDTVKVMTNEGLHHRIIVTYNVEIYPKKMSYFHYEEYEKNEDMYFKKNLFIPIDEKLKTEISHIRFEDSDSVLGSGTEFIEKSFKVVRLEALKRNGVNDGIIISNVQLSFEFDPVLVRYLKTEKPI